MFTGSIKDEINNELLILFFFFLNYYRVGRRQISKQLKIGEGKVRKILIDLNKRGLVDIKRGGTSLSEKGQKKLINYFKKLNVVSIKLINTEEICSKCIATITLLRNINLSKSVVEIRDHAVRAGALGTLILIVNRKKDLFLPPDIGSLSKYYPGLDNRIKSSFKLLTNDLILVIFSNNLKSTLAGTIKVITALSSKE